MPLQNRVDPFGDIHAVSKARPVHRQSRHHPRPRHEDAAEEALDDQGLDHLRLRLQGQAARSDGPQHAERQRRLDRTVLPRRGDGAGRRPPALLLLPARGGKGFRRAASARPSASPSRKAPRSTAAAHGAAGFRRKARDDHRRRASPALPDGAMIAVDGNALCRARAAGVVAMAFQRLWRARRARRHRHGAMRQLITPPTTSRCCKAGYQAGLASDDRPRRADRWLDPAAARPFRPAMRANYKMQRLFVPDDLAAGQAIRCRPSSRATI